MLNAEFKQFTLQEDGTIMYQANSTNPLPGVKVGQIKKGETILSPQVDVDLPQGATFEAIDKDAAASHINAAVKWNIEQTLAPLVGMQKAPEQLQKEIEESISKNKAEKSEKETKEDIENEPEDTKKSDNVKLNYTAPENTSENNIETKTQEEPVSFSPAVTEIKNKLFEDFGTTGREGLEAAITNLGHNDRRILRSYRIRLGPILIFQPDLNKPAAVRMRALLWSLFNDKPLPAPVPNDGMVSVKIEEDTEENINKEFYRTIAYPVYGPRAIRIDMLDRVVNAVYEAADKGKFQAQHKMAEWLGTSIADLYKILEALGHTKLHDPAEELEKKAAQVEGANKDQSAPIEESLQTLKSPAQDVTPETKQEDSTPIAEDTTPEKQIEKPEIKSAEKPELATFRLKKGKAFKSQRSERKPFNNNKKPYSKDDKKPYKNDRKKGKRNKNENRTPRVMSTGPKPKLEDSPFAILEQLKIKGDGKK